MSFSFHVSVEQFESLLRAEKDRMARLVEAARKLRAAMLADDQLQDIQRFGVLTPEQLQEAWTAHRAAWEVALKETQWLEPPENVPSTTTAPSGTSGDSPPKE